jgi:hypothetical protein
MFVWDAKPERVDELASGLLPYRQIGPARHRFHDAVLAATAQVHGHGLLTKRQPVFGAGTQVKVAPP